MMNRIHIKNGRIVDPANDVDTIHDLYLADGKILAIGQAPTGFTADQEIDATGQIVCPGLIDLQANLCEPGHEHKATIKSEVAAAASGGITTLCCSPDTLPAIDHPAIAEFIQHRAQHYAKTRVLPIGALTEKLDGNQLSEMAALQASGCIALSNARRPIMSTRVLRHCFEYAATLGLTVFITPEDAWLAEGGCVHEGIVSTRFGLAGIPTTAETIALARDLLLIEQTGVKAHFSRLSSGHAVDLIAAARERGLTVTADVTAHHLHLTEIDVSEFNTLCHVRPPLRSVDDQRRLQLGVKSGIIQAICSDHQPQEADAKLLPFPHSAPGISGLETLLALTLRLVDMQLIKLSEAIALLTSQPAKILNIPTGSIEIGAIADICIFNPNQHWTIKHENFISKGHNTPFMDWELRGQVTHTLREGKIIYLRGH